MTRVPGILFTLLFASCLTCRAEKSTTQSADAATTAATTSPAEVAFARQRADMVQKQLAARDITNKRVLDAMGRVPRHRFVLPRWEAAAYDDDSLPINEGQTISQPYIVALMTQLADP